MKSKSRCWERIQTVLQLVVLTVVLRGGMEQAIAADDTWQGGANIDWFAPTNWSLGNAPTLGDNATINNGQTARIQGTTVATADNLRIDAGTVTIGSVFAGTLTVNGEISVGALGSGRLNVDYGTASFNTLTLDSGGSYSDSASGTNILTGTAPTIQLANGISATMNAQVQGNNGLTKGGLGSLTLANDNTYSGGTTITVGTLQIGNGADRGTLGAGSVTNNGTLIFNRNNTMVVSNDISGSGIVRQSGTGTTVLTGDNTYNGVTTVTAGTLQIGNGGTGGSLGSANVVNNGTLAFNRSDTIVVSNQISGTGSVAQSGPGTTVLTNNNTYSGQTVINSGTLKIGDGGTVGSLGRGSIVNNGALVYDRSDSVTVSNQMSGSGSFTQDGSGTLVVTGDNTHTGTNYINSGTMQVGNGGGTGSLGAGPVVNNSALVFNRNNTLVATNQISGSGTVTQDGTGRTVLAGNNTHTGTNYINNGTLQVGNGGSSGTLGTGNVVNNSHLAFNRADTMVVSNNISGSGDVTQDGAGKTVVAGNNTYSGTTTINAGILQVGNNGTTGTLGTGNVTNNGTLILARSDSTTIANQISGTGSLVQSNGTVTLTAENTYSGSTTVISNSTLRVGNGGTSGSLGTGNIVDNGALVYDRSDVVSIDNVISGTGSLTNTGTGTTILGSDNTYSGVTTISSGTLQVGNGSTSGTLGSGNVVNNGALVINRADHYVIDNSISGTGSLTNVGTGTNLLTGNNTYTGPTTILTNSTLQVGNVGTSGSLGSGNVVNDGNLSFARTDTIVVSNAISGVGSLYQNASGTTILTGNNTYSGTNFINVGTLQVGNGGTSGSLGTGGVTNNGILVFNRSDSVLIANQIGGNGSVIVTNGGVTFTADNTYAGTTTINSNATVQVGNGGAAGSLGKGNIANDGALVFNRSDAVTVSNQISGSGSLAQSGPDRLILAANNTYTGTNFINSGVLQVGNGGTSGSIGTNVVVNNGGLALNRSDDITVANRISGTGSLYLQGDGSVTLTSSNTFTGGTWMTNQETTLYIRDGHALGNGDVNLISGTFGVDNTLDTNLAVYVGGDFLMGSNITVNYRFGTIGGSNFWDRIFVAGTATLDGTNRLIGGYRARPNDEFVLITATNGFAGGTPEIDNQLTHSPLLAALTYVTNRTDSSDLVLFWQQQSFVNYLTISNNISLRPNQASVAAALDTIGSSTNDTDKDLLEHLNNLASLTNNLPTAFDLIAPDELTAMAQAAFSFMDADSERFLKRAADLQADYYRKYSELRKYAVNQAAFDDYINKPWDIYFEPMMDFANVKEDNNASGYDIQRMGVSAGADRRVSANIFVGGALGIGSGKADLVNGGKIDMTAVSGQFYGMWFEQGLHIEAMIGGIYTTYDSERASINGKAKGDTTGFGFTGLVGGGYDWENGPWKIGPRAAMQFETVNVNGFTETGSLAPLDVDSQEATAAHAQFGLNVRYQRIKNRWTYITPELFLGWRHEFGDDQLSVDSKFATGSGSSFTVNGPKLGRDSILGSLGISVQWKPSFNTYANFTTQMGRDGYDAQSLNLGTRVGF